MDVHAHAVVFQDRDKGVAQGRVVLHGEDVSKLSIAQRIAAGLDRKSVV